MVEPHEPPERGAVRELAEETGLLSEPEALHLVSTSTTTVDGRRSLAWNFVTRVDDPGLAVSDPDGHVLDVCWFGRADAIELLSRLPYRPLSEPAVAHLSGSARPGVHWAYEDPSAEPVVTTPG
jgi:8-oxo-dGTP diphosphatase